MFCRHAVPGGILHKASRAALKVPLPVGLLYAENQTVMLDPDAQIQQAVRLLFATFKRTGSAWATVKYFRTKAARFPTPCSQRSSYRRTPLDAAAAPHRAQSAAQPTLRWGLLFRTNPDTPTP